MNNSIVKKAESFKSDPDEAVEELCSQFGDLSSSAGILFFCSADYEPKALAKAISIKFPPNTIGCTTAGEIGTKYSERGIVAVSFDSIAFSISNFLIKDIDSIGSEQFTAFRQQLKTSRQKVNKSCNNCFALCLIDGLSLREERVTAEIYQCLEGIPLVGGSAGDSLKFEETRVFNQGQFYSSAAVVSVINTSRSFEIYKLQHFEPSDLELVITVANPKKRIVYEIDGGPAAEEYAALLGLEKKDLNSQVFSKNPVMLQIGSEWYVRSIQKVNPDDSLSFFCAIEEGIPLTIAKGVGFVETLKQQVDQLVQNFDQIDLTIGCDCILRRLELVSKGINSEVEKELSRINFVGFSTFGEQFNSIHVNQTLTGVVIGERKR